MVLAVLPGCSDSPSDDDVSRVVQDMIGECKYLTVVNMMKVNFPLAEKNDYQVDIQYSIKSTPLPDAKKIADGLAPTLAGFDTRFKTALLERDDDFDVNKEFLEKISGAKEKGDAALADAYQDQRSRFITENLDPSLEKVRTMIVEKTELIQQATITLRNEFLHVCPNTTAVFYNSFFDKSDLSTYAENTTKDFATSIYMTKKSAHWEIKH